MDCEGCGEGRSLASGATRGVREGCGEAKAAGRWVAAGFSLRDWRRGERDAA